MLLVKIQEPHHQPNARDETHHSIKLVGIHLTISTDNERYNICSTPLAETSCHTRKITLQRKRGPFVHTRNPRTSRGKDSTEFLLAADPGVRPCERAPPNRLRRKRQKPSNKRSSCQAGFALYKDRQAVHFMLFSPLDETQKIQYKDCQHYFVDMGRAQEKNIKFYHTFNGCIVCFDTIPKECTKKVIRSMDRTGTEAGLRGAVAHTLSEKDASDTIVEPDRQGVPLTEKGCRQRYFARSNCMRDINSIQHWQLTSPPMETWQRQTQMLRRLVKSKIKRRSRSCNPLPCLPPSHPPTFESAMIQYSAESWQRRATHGDSVEVHWHTLSIS